MKKVFLGLILAADFGGYIYWSSHNAASVIVANNNPAPDAAAVDPTSQPVAAGLGTGSGTAPVRALFKDGTYKGDVASTIFGDIQVSAVISGGKLVDVKALKYPSDRQHSLEISNSSLPTLKREAIAAQSAQVDVVSGATQTTEGFQQSLKSALSQAQA